MAKSERIIKRSGLELSQETQLNLGLAFAGLDLLWELAFAFESAGEMSIYQHLSAACTEIDELKLKNSDKATG